MIGASMLLIAMAYMLYLGNEKRARIDAISQHISQYEIARLADVIREDAYNTTLSTLRASLQDYFATTPLYPPKEAWEDEEKFKEWFESNLSNDEQFLRWVARALAAELLSYRYVREYAKDYIIGVDIEEEKTVGVLRDAVRLVVNDDGTFTFVIDTRNLSEEQFRNLPTIKVCQMGSCTSFVVFPSGIWTFPVPLRIMEAYRKAREVYWRVKSRKDEFKIAFGFCKKTGTCGIWKYRWGFERVFPRGEDTLMKRLPELQEGPVTIKFITSPCTSQIMLEENMPEEYRVSDIPVCCGPCSDLLPPDYYLLLLLQKKIKELAPDDVNVDVDPVSIREFRTFRVLKQEGFSLVYLFAQSVGLDMLIEWGLIPRDIASQAFTPTSECKDGGYVYCYAPVMLSYIVSWEDTNPTYRVKNYPARFLFRQTLTGFEDMESELESLEERATSYQLKPPEMETVEFNQIKCRISGADLCWQNFERAVVVCNGGDASTPAWQFCLGNQNAPGCIVVLTRAYLDNASLIPEAIVNWLLDQNPDLERIKLMKEYGRKLYFYEMAKKAITLLPTNGEECNQLKSSFICPYEKNTCEFALCYDLNNYCKNMSFENGVPGGCGKVGTEATIYSLFYLHITEQLRGECRPQFPSSTG